MTIPAQAVYRPTVCLVGCSKTKFRAPAPAKELYSSPLFQLCRRWAEQHADAWAIISARYGVVQPDQVIAPYDTTIAQRRPDGLPQLTTREFGGWLAGQVQVWCCRYATPRQGPHLIVLAGKDYWKWLDEARMDFTVPLDGLSVGQRLRWLKQHTTGRSEEQGTPSPQPILFPDILTSDSDERRPP